MAVFDNGRDGGCVDSWDVSACETFQYTFDVAGHAYFQRALSFVLENPLHTIVESAGLVHFYFIFFLQNVNEKLAVFL